MSVRVSPEHFELGSDQCTGTQLAPEESCQVEVSFGPQSEGRHSGILTFSAENAGSVTTQLTGHGASPGPLSVTPTPHDFGLLIFGEPALEKTFAVEADSEVGTFVVLSRVRGGDGSFRIVQNSCDGATLNPARCQLTVRFDPRSPGMKSALLTIIDESRNETLVGLSGFAALPAELEISPVSHNFGSQPLFETSSETFTVLNRGDVAATEMVASLEESPAFDITADDCGSELAGGATCTVDVSFRPETPGSHSALLSIDASESSTTARVKGEGHLSPEASATPSVHDFGSAVIGQLGETVSIVLRNLGDRSAGTLQGEVGGVHPDDFVIVDDTCDGELDAREQCSIDVQFRPSAVGARSALLDVTTEHGGSLAIALNGVGNPVPPQLQVTPDSVNFGAVGVLNNAAETFTVENVGGADSGVPLPKLTGENASHFFIEAHDCTTGLSSGETCSIQVVFEPLSMGDKIAFLDVSASPGGAVSAQLQGVGTSSDWIWVNSTVLTFADVQVGNQSAPQDVEVVNIATGPLGPITTTIGADFTIDGDSCTGQTIAPGDNCIISVRFAPQSAGLKSQTLEISASPGGSFSVGLNGRAL